MKDQLDIEHHSDGDKDSPDSGPGREERVDNVGGGAGEVVWDSSLGFGGVMPEPMEDIDVEEEAWMGYVRQQLNTLFPDFFHPDPLGPLHEEEHTRSEGTPGLDGEGDTSISTIATNELPTPPFSGSLTRFGSGSHFGPIFGFESDTTTQARVQGPGQGEGGMGGIGGVGGVPNVRQELGGLRDEIERLRGVVSGLAEGMRAQPTTTTTSTPTSTSNLQPSKGGGMEQESGRGGEPTGPGLEGGRGDDNTEEISQFHKVSQSSWMPSRIPWLIYSRRPN